MQRKLLLLGWSLVLPFGLLAQDEAVNVMNYYAVGNTLDGQPMIGMVNLLRFYPVFAMRQGTEAVVVTIYYGSKIFTRAAEKMDDGKYWQALLPRFRLGEAIQRIEVEARLDLEALNLIDEELRKKMDELTTQIDNLEKEGFKKEEVNPLAQSYVYNREQYNTKRDSRLASRGSSAEKSKRLDDLVGSYTTSLTQLQKLFLSVKDSLFELIHDSLADTSFSGPSVRRSDIVIDYDVHSVEVKPKARILYRNDKRSLRRLFASDPAERLGIFRIRYVPFPVVGTKERPRMHLVPPLGENSAAVFEVGLAFGDVIVPGDEFVMPEFSWRRLGVAFAITENLFSQEAEIIGLLATYDFNSYGSIGLGGNFAGDEVHGYASFGINKKAFDAVLAGLAGLFR
jgi:hypothetical protein